MPDSEHRDPIDSQAVEHDPRSNGPAVHSRTDFGAHAPHLSILRQQVARIEDVVDQLVRRFDTLERDVLLDMREVVRGSEGECPRAYALGWRPARRALMRLRISLEVSVPPRSASSIPS